MIKRGKDRRGLLHNFRVTMYAHYYAHVFIWASQADMLRNSVDVPDDALAVFCPAPVRQRYSRKKGWGAIESDPKMGEVHLIEDTIKGGPGAGAVAHEFTHAAFHMANILGIDLTKLHDGSADDPEEAFCQLVQFPVARFWHAWWKRHA